VARDRLFALVIIHTGDSAQPLPSVHARFPDHGRRIDQAEAKRIVELLDVQALHVVTVHQDMPNLIVSK